MQKKVTVLQKGAIYFLYRPKIDKEKINSLNDVQRIYLILKPTNYSKFIQIIAAKKQLPDTIKTTHFAFVNLVTASEKIINQKLGKEDYHTRTRGERHQSKVRILGEGKYLIVLHKGHTHLAYQLLKPKTPKTPQRNVKINKAGEFVISVKNPLIKAKKTGLQLEKKAVYPKKLQDKFDSRRFISLNPPDFIKYEGTEILLIGQDYKKIKKFTKEIKQEFSLLPMKEIREIFTSLRDEISMTPIFAGEWV
jgi:hypothetical protein